MELIDYLKSLPGDARDEFAKRCESSDGHLTNVAYGYKPCGIALAVSIEQQSGGIVTRKVLRKDDWQRYWPELCTQEQPSATQEAGHA